MLTRRGRGRAVGDVVAQDRDRVAVDPGRPGLVAAFQRPGQAGGIACRSLAAIDHGLGLGREVVDLDVGAGHRISQPTQEGPGLDIGIEGRCRRRHLIAVDEIAGAEHRAQVHGPKWMKLRVDQGVAQSAQPAEGQGRVG